MIYLDSSNKNQILTFIPLIRNSYADWHIVSIRFDTTDDEEVEEIINQFIESYKNINGFIYRENEKKAVSVIRLGKIKSYSKIQESVEENIKNKKCRILTKKMSASGLKQIQISLSKKGSEYENNLLFQERESRDKNVILIADDDMFIRKTLASLLKNVAEIYEVEKGNEVLDSYKKVNPDIVLLDIHMPNENGLDVISNLHKEDFNAFLVVSSFDSIKENVLEAVERGAIGFLAKPVQKEKLFMYLDQCITFTNKEREEELCQIRKRF